MIISDQRRACGFLTTSATFSYGSVSRSLYFVDSEDPTVHTQNIENYRLHAKKRIKA
ncbi:hypothetical protein AAJ76_1820002876 [Vairimorpha ceranae]|uniref:Uncharacterized protein n=1 Tax=Vairimorpha ceranae TaxID=40302 RepID=A0A0F9YM91_9MICR|nr:hypothetical protein AAJ76_1820002876 [Vairimorpha ceranae]KKO73902.1 hypothetical protein AAJ76_1820002876 [Vairimorpha ceranae]